MKSKIRIISLFTFIFVSSSSFAQYKYDLGLKVSSYEMEQYQFEGRFHLNTPYTITSHISTGTRNRGGYAQVYNYSDSTMSTYSNSLYAKGTTIKLGIQRKLDFLATNVFYAGATIGLGWEAQRRDIREQTYAIQDSLTVVYPPIGLNEINSLQTSRKYSAKTAQMALSFGMDIPLTQHILINTEIAFSGTFYRSDEFSSTSFTLRPMLSGGVRYRFGKRE